eukprot:g1652.t1
MEQLGTEILKAWPRPRRNFNPCRCHVKFELELYGPCKKGLRCRYSHCMKMCKNKSECTNEYCSYLHPSDAQTLRRLDTRLDAIMKKNPEMSVVKALEQHRKNMIQESKDLLVKARQRVRIFDHDIAEEQSRECASANKARLMNATVEALRSKQDELRKQIAEYSRAKMKFFASPRDSFRAARIFARDTYNRFPACLPVYAERTAIEEALAEDFSVLVLSADTGSGKSTQVVQYLTELLPGKRIVCTQPRRVAAVSLADRVAEELQTLKPRPPGRNVANLVGCVGGSSLKNSRVMFQTDASLLRRLYDDEMLKGISAVIVDEVHERSITTDILIALLRRALQLRAQNGKHPFRIVLTSATMNSSLFAKYFSRKTWDASSSEDAGWARIMKIPGRTFPVTVSYDGDMEHSASRGHLAYERLAEAKAIELHKQMPKTDLSKRENHDILIFLTQALEVERLARNLASKCKDAVVLPLHGGLDKDEQRKVFDPMGDGKRRKIVVATNIAETSITIDGVGVVIDSGYAKTAMYDARKDATVLTICPISQSSARQRAGRAGRTAPGRAIRLYSEADFDEMPRDQPAEILRADTTQAILTVLRFLQKRTDWIDDVSNFPFIEHPGKERLDRALELLFYLGAIESKASSKLTDIGTRMAAMETSPRISAVLLRARKLGVASLACVAVGMLTVGDRLFRRGRSDDEKEKAKQMRTKFAAKYPMLGDMGSAIAVWIETRAMDYKTKKTWCEDHSVSPYQHGLCRRSVKGLLYELIKSESSIESSSEGATKSDEHSSESAKTVEAKMNEAAKALNDPEKVKLLVDSFISGYYSNLAFSLPEKKRYGRTMLPYFLPHCDAISALGNSCALSYSTGKRPNFVFFMELTESDKGRMYMGSVCGIDGDMDRLKKALPDSYVKSPKFKGFLKLTERKQMLANPATAETKCAIAFKRVVGYRDEGLQSRVKKWREEWKIPKDVELIVESNRFDQTVNVMSNDSKLRERIAAELRREFDAVFKELQSRKFEFPVPGTSVRAVIGAGGECVRLLRSPKDSIVVRFSADLLDSRLLEPVTILKSIPEGLFESLADPNGAFCIDSKQAMRHLLVNLDAGKHISKAKRAQTSGKEDLRKVKVEQILSAITYTAGGVACYGVNGFLRNLNETKCKEHASHIRSLLAFCRERAKHATNKRHENRILYRGSMLPRKFVADYTEDSIVLWPAFTSTTTNVQVAKMFGGDGGGDDTNASMLFEIHGAKWCPLNDISVFPGEQEILLPAFSAFKVIKVDNGDGGRKKAIRVVLQLQPNTLEAMREFEVKNGGASKSSEEEESDDIADDTIGPIILDEEKILSGAPKLPGLAGVSDVLQRLFRSKDFDQFASVRCKVDEHSKSVRGRVYFSDPDRARKACRVLNGSLLNDRILTVQAAPIATESSPMRNRVIVSCTSVEHKGQAFLECFDAKIAESVLGASTGKGGKAWRSLTLRDGSTTLSVGVAPFKGKKNPDPTRDASKLVISGVPTKWTAMQLVDALKAAVPRLPRFVNANMKFDHNKLQAEEKRLHRLGQKFERHLQHKLSKTAGKALEAIEKIRRGGVGVNGGGRYDLWFRSAEAADAAARRLDGTKVKTTEFGSAPVLKVSARTDNSIDMFVNVPNASFGKELDSIVEEANKVAGVAVRKPPSRKPPLRNQSTRIFISGDDKRRMGQVYRDIRTLQRGLVIHISPFEQLKVFPRKLDHRNTVKKKFEGIARTNNCFIQMQMNESLIRLLGARNDCMRCAQRLRECISKQVVKRRFWCPKKWRDEKKKLVDTICKETEKRVKVSDPPNRAPGIVVEMTRREDFDIAKETWAEYLEENDVECSDERTCIVCFERNPTSFGLATCGCNVCDGCLQEHVNTCVTDLRFPITCPSTTCTSGKKLLDEDIKRAAPNLDKARRAAVNVYVQTKGSEKAFCCRTPDCPQILAKTGGAMTCSICLYKQCTKCGEAGHDGMSCKEYKDSQSNDMRFLIADIKSRMLQPRCMACDQAFIDFTGCFALTCNKCGSHFCGYCLHNCGSKDAHAHVASCAWQKKHLNDIQSGYWGGHQGNTFERCMKIRLSQLLLDYLDDRCPDRSKWKQITKACQGAMNTAELFDLAIFKKMAKERTKSSDPFWNI